MNMEKMKPILKSIKGEIFMEKLKFRKITALFMVVVLLLAMAGCGKKTKNGTEAETKENVEVPETKEMVYKGKPMMITGVEDSITSFEMQGDKLYFMTYLWIPDKNADKEHEEELQGTYIYDFYTANADGSDVKEIKRMECEEKEFLSSWTAADDSTILYVTGQLDGKKGTYSVIKMDSDGKELFKQEITKDTELNPTDNKEIAVVTDVNGKIVLISENGAFLFDENAKFLSKVTSKESLYCKTAKTKDGQIICAGNDGEMSYALLLDTDKKVWSKKYELGGLEKRGDWDLKNGIEYDFYYNNDSGIYGYDLTKEKSVKLVDYMASNLTGEHIDSICPVEMNKLMGLSSEGASNKLMVYDKVDPAAVKERQTIILGGVGIDPDLQTKVAEFNKENKNYMIKIKDYYDEDNSEEKMNADIIAGHMPDILYLNDAPLEMYAAKGMLEDLTPYYEKDSELSVEDILPGVVEGMTIDGKICFVSPKFSIVSVAGNTEDVGDKMGWTFQDMQDALEKKGSGTIPFVWEDKVGLLWSFFSVYDDFINWDTGECSFDSPEFKAILELCNKGNAEENMGEDGPPERYPLIKSGKTLLADCTVSIDNVQMFEELFDGEVTFVGYPCEDKVGSYFTFSNMLGMSSSSEVKDGVWEFIRTFMTKEYQDTLGGGADVLMDSTRTDSFEKMIEQKMQPNFYAEKYVDTHTSWCDYAVELKPVTKEQVEKYKELILHTKKPMQQNMTVINIIIEESQAYFAGDKDVDETAKIIQNRITTYVNEVK